MEGERERAGKDAIERIAKVGGFSKWKLVKKKT